ncbi:MAG TPA: hypothetical protein VK186_26785 [Candidatus Deferrimicrobium sp.]|nr:hypothetical protein [Candidatus Deferrimicrobium sp.]
MKNIIILSTCLVLMSLLVNCPGKVDITRDFAMVLNGNEYKVNLGPAVGKMQENESGFSVSNAYKVVFPTKGMNRFETSGFELSFDPQKITPGDVITSTANDENYSLHLYYFPILGIKFNEEKRLVYSSRSDNGSLKVRFDVLEPEIGGRVKGVILEAVLYSFYDSNREETPQKPEKSQKLEIYNFVFDTTFKNSVF